MNMKAGTKIPTIVTIFVVVAIASVLMTFIRFAVTTITTTRPATYIGTTYIEGQPKASAERTYDLADDAV